MTVGNIALILEKAAYWHVDAYDSGKKNGCNGHEFADESILSSS